MTPSQFDQWLREVKRPPLVMGVLNVTPDSFSDGGRFAGADAAVARFDTLADEGADLIDVGGESTKPGSKRVEDGEQIRRVLPVIQAVAKHRPDVMVSIDTTRSAVAEAALDAGASMINDISAGRDDPAMLQLVARRGVPIVLMHMQGTPATMQIAPTYNHVTEEIRSELQARCDADRVAAIDRHQILVDPGIGFGKDMSHNLQLIREIHTFTGLGFPLVVGVSRKGFIGRITHEPEPARRLFGTAASVAWCVANGADIVRVHDVGPMTQVVRMIRAIRDGPGAMGFS